MSLLHVICHRIKKEKLAGAANFVLWYLSFGLFLSLFLGGIILSVFLFSFCPRLPYYMCTAVTGPTTTTTVILGNMQSCLP